MQASQASGMESTNRPGQQLKSRLPDIVTPRHLKLLSVPSLASGPGSVTHGEQQILEAQTRLYMGTDQGSLNLKAVQP